MFRRLSTLFIILVGTLVLVSSARADNLSFHFANSAGTPLQAFITLPGGSYQQADINGNLTLDLNAGQTINISRTYETGTCGDPDAITYTVPDSLPTSTINIVLPVLLRNAPNPGISAAERYMVGLINQLRHQNGVAPVQISTILSTDADRYAAFLPQNEQAAYKLAHCGIADPYARVVDGGGGVQWWSEDISFETNAKNAFNELAGSSSHFAVMVDATPTVIGVAQEGDNWVLDFGTCPALYQAYCGLTGDEGDLTNPYTSSPTGSSGKSTTRPTAKQQSSKLQLTQIKHHERTTTFTVTTTHQARGQLHVTAQQGRHYVRMHHNGKHYRFTASRPGSWLITVSFRGKSGWKSETIERSIYLL